MAENQLILIADDYGLSAGINAGILELLRHSRLSGTSALVNLPDFVTGASALASFKDQADIGLHLNLTAGGPLTRMRQFAPDGRFPEIGRIMNKAWISRIDRAEIAQEIHAQIEQFKTHIGCLPHYIDGHQHVHGLAFIREALFDVLRALPDYRPWLRSGYDHPIRIIRRNVMIKKSLMIAGLSFRLHLLAKKHGYRINSSFSGASDFNAQRSYATDFKQYLCATTPRHLVMCHPGYVASEDVFPDTVRDSRPIELQFLMSDEFLKNLAGAKLVIGHMRDAHV